MGGGRSGKDDAGSVGGRGEREHAERVVGVLDIWLFIPESGSKPAGGEFEPLQDEIASREAESSIVDLQIAHGVEGRERGEGIAEGNTGIGGDPAVVLLDILEEIPDVGNEGGIDGPQEFERGDRCGSRVGTTAAHGGDFDKAAVVALPMEEEFDNAFRLGDGSAEQIVRDHDEKRLVGAAELPFGSLGVAAVVAPQLPQLFEKSIEPGFTGLIGQEQVGSPGQLHGKGTRDPVQQIHGGMRLVSLGEQIVRDQVRGLPVESSGESQGSDGKAGVIEIGIALASPEAAIRGLLPEDKLAMPIPAVHWSGFEPGKQVLSEFDQVREFHMRRALRRQGVEPARIV